MTELKPGSAGAMLFFLGIIWAVILFFVVGDVAAIAGGVVASVGLLAMAAFQDQDQDDGPPGADELDRQ
jgi:hypothetical protein